MIPDITFWTVPTFFYGAILLVCLYGVTLFSWWWWKIGRATEVYGYVTGLLFSIGLTAAIGLHARFLHANFTHEIYDAFVVSWWWALGPLFVLVVLCAIVFRMTRRIWRTHAYRKGFKVDRRHADKLKPKLSNDEEVQ
jgi:hypothetical protein